MQPSSSRWEQDKRSADAFMPAVKSIMGRFILVEPTAFEDQQENTDLKVFVVRGTRIAVRMRTASYMGHADEFTIRMTRPSGRVTELEKIADGWGDWLFYGFGDYSTAKILSYVVVDLARFRRRCINNTPPIVFSDRVNADGSAGFRAFKVASFGSDVIVHRYPR